VTQCLAEEDGVFVAASDYMKVLPDSISRWVPRPLHALGTDGFGRSESRRALRNFFEVDSRYITLAALNLLYRDKKIKRDVILGAMEELEIDPNKANPMVS
jgi:pyruvate dehydrogenase E1 component